jgi:hypothetical protein
VHNATGDVGGTISAVGGGAWDTFKSSSGLFSSIALILHDKAGFIGVGSISTIALLSRLNLGCSSIGMCIELHSAMLDASKILML